MAGLALALLPLHEKDRLEQRRPLKHEGQAEPQEEPLHWPWDRTTVPVSGLWGEIRDNRFSASLSTLVGQPPKVGQ